ncbi:MAG: CBS domain-containing protein [Bacteroidales bacterium]|jgi:pentose-5-phosphate-3-epimerase/CBS domain-containing protein|nr:CBS domain-containing protein [Bacteroidales bacterium]
MLVSASIFAVKDNFLDYAQQLKYANADYLHVDLFQNSTCFKLEDILVFDGSYLPLDIHLIYEEIDDAVIDIINRSTAAYLTVQYENMHNKQISIEKIKQFKGSAGIAITPKTNIKMIEKYINDINHVLIMCSEPGITGARFNNQCYDLIRDMKNSYPNLRLHADGGIEADVAERMNSLGISLVISGSYLAKNIHNLHQNIYKLKYSNEENISVKRNMTKLNHLPIVQKDTQFFDVLMCINQGRIGCCFVIDDNRLAGMITDGDIRRAYLKYRRDVFDALAGDVMNKNPFVVSGSATISKLYEYLKHNKKEYIKVIPVVENDLFIGAFEL